MSNVSNDCAMQLTNVAVAFSGKTAVRDVTFNVAKNKVTSLSVLRVLARRRCCAH